MSENKYKRYSEKIHIFNGLDPQDVEFILHSGKVIHYHENQVIFHEGMLGSNLFVVLSGEVGIYQKNTLIGKCKVGDAFGEMAVLNHTPRSATATALMPSKCFTLDERNINSILDKRIAVRLLLNIIHVLSERLESANAQNAEMRRRLASA
jgi:CRP-like cAMP-binding protein